MPPLTAEPLVFVFHSTNKISGAKVKKYTTASEKGLSVYEEIRAPTPGSAARSSPFGKGNATSGRRQRLQPVNFHGGPTAYSATHPPPKKRKPKPVRKINLDTDIQWEDGITVMPEPEWLSDSDDTSSSVSPPPPTPRRQRAPRAKPTVADREYGSAFASYYILDDDDGKGKDDAPAPPVRPPKPAKKSDAHRQQSNARHPQHLPYAPPQMQGPHQSIPNGLDSSAGRPAPGLPPPPQYLPIVPAPRVNIVDNIRHNRHSDKPATLQEMNEKLNILSDALVGFGGAPPRQDDPKKPPQAAQANAPANSARPESSHATAEGQSDEPVNGLLAMFDDDDDSDDDGARSGPVIGGNHDADLSYGIEFIMNALRTWARQRIDTLYHQQWLHYNEIARMSHMQAPPPKKGRGRPRKEDVQARQQFQYPAPPPPVVNEELTSTPEGKAVQAFQDVVDCGVLKVNAMMPVELTRALGKLYVQIDNLINNSTRDQGRWQCMSYQAQIKAHNIKVQRWKEQVARMQEEMVRQQDLAHQQVMAQMGVPPHLKHRPQQQPHISQHLTGPMDIDPRRSTVVVPSSSASPANGGAGHPPNASSRPSPHHPGTTLNSNGDRRSRESMSHGTLYQDGAPADMAPEHRAQLQMRSGQSLKFSFTHENNPKAREVWGKGAFPEGERPSSIPRRGPMGPIARPGDQSRALSNDIRPGSVNGHMSTPVLGSNAPPLNGTAKTGTASIANPKVNGTNGVHTQNSETGDDDAADRASEPLSASAPPRKSTARIGRKRKHSEDDIDITVASASASPATRASRSATKPTLRVGRSTRRSTTSAASPTEEAVVIED